MKTISHRDLQNHVVRVLRQVQAGERFRITLNGRPVADLLPLPGTRQQFVQRDVVERILQRAPLDAGFTSDVEQAAGATIDEL